jgi:basic amino acid/polyamine antiporter, APA family
MRNSGIRSAGERLYAGRGWRIAGHHRRSRSRRFADLVAACSRCRWTPATLSGIAFASLLAFFAFVGFEDLANVVEEAKAPYRDIPRAMVLTLLISTALYVAVVGIAISAVPSRLLASSPAPLSLVFRQVAGVSPVTISAIAIVATLNTILAQMTMAARVIYGMARQGDLPAMAGHVHPRTALLRLRHRRVRSSGPHVSVPVWVPAVGLATCLAMIAAALAK